jgi:hypothetical protein
MAVAPKASVMVTTAGKAVIAIPHQRSRGNRQQSATQTIACRMQARTAHCFDLLDGSTHTKVDVVLHRKFGVFFIRFFHERINTSNP